MSRLSIVCLSYLLWLSACAALPVATVPTAAVPPPAAATAVVVSPTVPPPSPTQPAPTVPPPSPMPTPPPTATAAPTAVGSFLVYSRPDGSLWRVGADAAPIQLAPPSEPGVIIPWAAAPDARTIAYITGSGAWATSSPSDPPPMLALWMVNSDGSNPRMIQTLLPPAGVDLTPGGDDASNRLPALTSLQQLAWSPDGAQVAFVSAHENQVDVYTAALDGSVMRLSDTPLLEQGPVWSPDGARLAYRTTNGFGTGAGWDGVGLAVVPGAGGAPLQTVPSFTIASDQSATAMPALAWAGPETVVVALAAPPSDAGAVQAVALADGAVTQLSETTQGSGDLLEWNPQSQTLAIAGTALPALYVWRPGDPQPTRLSEGAVGTIAWTPDGDGLAYSAEDGPHAGVTVWAIGADGDLRHFQSAPVQRLLWSLDGRRLVADRTIYDRVSKVQGELPDGAQPLGWGTDGLYFYSNTNPAADATDGTFWRWIDGATQQLEAGIGSAAGAAVVWPRP